jgi:diguanylate cyclase (GGDEF)-like protein
MLEQVREKISNIIFPEGIERRNSLERAAMTDRLTGLANRAAFEKAHAAARRDRQSFILFDLNSFGLLNKTSGHAEGDRVLRYYADVIHNVAQKYKCRAFRLGGDEFVVIAPPRFAYAVRDAIESRALARDFGDFCVSISGEVGLTLAEADSKIQSRKKARKAAGK